MFRGILSSMILLTTATILQQQNAHASPRHDTVQAHTGNGFDSGYAKAKYDFANNHVYNDSCSPSGVYCKQVPCWIRNSLDSISLETGTPYNQKLLTVNKTA